MFEARNGAVGSNGVPSSSLPVEISTSSAPGIRMAIAAPVGVPSAPQQSHAISVSDAASICSMVPTVASSIPGVDVSAGDELVVGGVLVSGDVGGGAVVSIAVAACVGSVEDGWASSLPPQAVMRPLVATSPTRSRSGREV